MVLSLTQWLIDLRQSAITQTMPFLLSRTQPGSNESAVNSKAHSTAKTMFREAGLAVAVLAIYVLTLLLPLHQAAGLQRDLNAIGYATLDSWSVCQPLAQDEDGDPHGAAALTCPAAGIAKHDLAVVLPPALLIEQPGTADVVHYARTQSAFRSPLPDHVGQSRAPPVTV